MSHNRARLIAELGQWLKQWSWQFFTTASPDPSLLLSSVYAARRAFEDGYIRRLEQRAQCSIDYAAVFARGDVGNHMHIHAFLIAPRTLLRSDVRASWRMANTDVQPYDRTASAAFYLAEHCFSNDADFVLSKGLSRYPRIN